MKLKGKLEKEGLKINKITFAHKYVIFTSITASIRGFLANEETSLTRNSNLMKAPGDFWGTILESNVQGVPRCGGLFFFFLTALYFKGFYRY